MGIIAIIFMLLAPCSGFIALYKLTESLFAATPTTDNFVIFGQWLLCFGAGVVGYIVALAALILIAMILYKILWTLFK